MRYCSKCQTIYNDDYYDDDKTNQMIYFCECGYNMTYSILTTPKEEEFFLYKKEKAKFYVGEYKLVLFTEESQQELKSFILTKNRKKLLNKIKEEH